MKSSSSFLHLWILLDILLLVRCEMSHQNASAWSSLPLKESPNCESQDLPAGFQEWKLQQEEVVVVQWAYNDNVSFLCFLVWPMKKCQKNRTILSCQGWGVFSWREFREENIYAWPNALSMSSLDFSLSLFSIFELELSWWRSFLPQ